MLEITKRACATALMMVFSLAWIAPLQAQLLPPLPLPGGRLIVAITSPASGATVGDTTTVSASVSIIGSLTVSSVQLQVDGANLGARDTSAPYSVSWNTSTAGGRQKPALNERLDPDRCL
jgi:Bacterial Ig domain